MKIIYCLIALLAALLIPSVAAAYTQFSGFDKPFNGYQYVLTNGEIIRSEISANYSKFVGFQGWDITTEVMGTGAKSTQPLDPITYVSLNSTYWLLVFDTNTSTVLLFTGGSMVSVFDNIEAPETFFTPSGITNYFAGFYGGALWGAIWALPAAMTYIRTKNPANSAIVLAFMMSISSLVVAELKPFAVLAIGVAVGALLFRILRPKASEQ